MRAAILATLRADATLVNLLTGGIFDGLLVGEVSRQTTPGAFDGNQELKPSLLVHQQSDVASGPLWTSARLGFVLYFYEQTGAATIDQARMRAYALLHRQRLAPGSGGAWEIRHTDDILGQRDDALSSALIVSRYSVFIRKG